MEYNKDYTTKTADEWFSLKKWSGFLMTIPLGRSVIKTCDNMREVLSIRATAAYLSGEGRDCGRTFSIETDVSDERKIVIKAQKK